MCRQVVSYSSVCPHTAIYVSSYCNMCVWGGGAALPVDDGGVACMEEGLLQPTYADVC